MLLSENGKMCINGNDGGDCDTELCKFSRYLVIGVSENGYHIKGIRSDAPAKIIDDYIAWYREHNRYENGRLRPMSIVRKQCIIKV